jgi:hypothetical protein
MADYYPLISRAVGGLDNNTGENRRALYERARAALLQQLRGATPPLDEEQITRERLALEEAIRKVEADAAQSETSPVGGRQQTSLRDQALRDFHKTVAEAEALGAAATEANRAMRSTYAHVPGGAASPPASPPSPPHEPLFEPPASEPPPPDLAAPDNEAPSASAWPPPDGDEYDYYKKPPRDWSRIIPVVVILLVVAAVAGGVYWQRHAIGTMIASLRSAPASKTAPEPKPVANAPPKIADRIGPSSSAPAPATAPAAAVAQKVVLYDEDPSDPQGKRYVGSAIWRTETVSPGTGLAPELAVRADVEIPERHMRMTWSLRRNSDKALPASHTIEIMFTVPPDFDQKGVNSVPGILMKSSEQARGVPLAGLSVKVTSGYFLIGLSAVDVDVQRNVALLKDRDWFDIPIVYATGKRAILAVEKGTPGQRAFEEAFRAWGE